MKICNDHPGPVETQGYSPILLLGPDPISRYFPPKVRAREQAGKSLGSSIPLAFQDTRTEAWKEAAWVKLPCLPVMEGDLVPMSILTRGALGRLASSQPSYLPQCGSASNSPIICFCSCRGAAASMDTVRGWWPGTYTADSWTCTWCQEHTSLNHMDRKGFIHLPYRVNTSIQERLWKREASSTQSGVGRQSP